MCTYYLVEYWVLFDYDVEDAEAMMRKEMLVAHCIKVTRLQNTIAMLSFQVAN
jgi:hypothetical protein